MMKKRILFITILVISPLFSCYDGLLDTYDNYKLRDRGPAGGWIFYINPNYKTDGWRYLEAAPEDWSGGSDPYIIWSTSTASYANGSSALPSALGEGSSNTDWIILQNSSGTSAAIACRDYRGGGYSDWFLPSKDELWEMCWNLKGIQWDSLNVVMLNNPDVPSPGVGGFLSGLYWSSTEDAGDVSRSWYQSFGTGNQGGNSKMTTERVRPIRAF